MGLRVEEKVLPDGKKGGDWGHRRGVRGVARTGPRERMITEKARGRGHPEVPGGAPPASVVGGDYGRRMTRNVRPCWSTMTIGLRRMSLRRSITFSGPTRTVGWVPRLKASAAPEFTV